jgi:hypothetical protein
MTVTRTITYTGSAARAGALVQMLEQQNVQVEWQPPREERGFAVEAEAVVVSLVACGLYDAIKAGVAQFGARFPHAKVEIEEDGEGSTNEETQRLQDRLDDELAKLADDSAATAARMSACAAIAQALFDIGRMVWLTGYVVGPDRKSGASPFGFGDDSVVGAAAVTQMGGELASGAVQLLKGGNLYAASALIRQVVEVEYLAHAFAEQHEKAATWLRADREQRLKFWSPAQLRKGSSGRFLASDYWHHCELGGHPTTRSMDLLPGHAMLNKAFLWVDLAGHLLGIWKHVVVSTERLLDGPIPADWKLPDVDAAIDEWLAADGLYAALQHLGSIIHGTTGDE